ncbi:aminotransferase class I/II-fold pyridoxal phosphate-dependent enzyme [Haloferax sp. MBLA0076]|uniref:Aminotransferase class I/II-fold pyridoxal phosphate-dependent enzyme n=1 Tax=Haloferax litoreum TaxID=2666140 RepID=A0A6A8GIB9_9EURY|nr:MULTISPECIES: aminotransferase class I/II-fold pyridoxal phosphate-dependent enzyme [Haloferax]KAB1192963.1 aminotransferase class I/II-fold pyridoxal phosphate-dependent enzyme [Haloferax sp. CBA1148]MRX21450.1 aminotransferase class I/II-fold pyridoxal phosphate-dependent enzyme [Haloferax litoreum]
MNDYELTRETLAVTHGERGQAPAPGVEDVVVPLHLSSTYSVPDVDPDADLELLDPDAGEYLYSRLSNPTRNALEHRLAALEGAEHALAFVSGTAAITATMTAMIRPGDHIVAFEDLYGGTKTMLNRLFAERLDVDVTFVDATDVANVEDAMREETRLIWMETPTNPLMHLCDIEAIAAIADEWDTIFGVDNTFLSPYFQNPLSLGADVVVHSTTKYLNGHSDSIGGAVVTNRDDIMDELAFLQRVGMGSMLSPFDSYMTLRGIKTLPLRMRQHEENAMEIARFLESHDAVTRVLYPGLESHPQHELAARQQSGFGGVLSFELDTDLDGTAEFLGRLREFPLAVSLGGVESLIEHPATMTHSPLAQTERDRLGISNSLLRMSVGVEHVDDLLADLDAALASV